MEAQGHPVHFALNCVVIVCVQGKHDMAGGHGACCYWSCVCRHMTSKVAADLQHKLVMQHSRLH